MSPMQYAKSPQNITSSVMERCALQLEKRRLTRLAKRTGDLLISAFLVVLLSPLFLVLAIAVSADSKGGVFFRQTRIGRYGVPFTILKFRTMRVHDGGSELTGREDDRVTRVGARIRGLRLDELPQLLNVLAGQMSLVGPRPESPRFVDCYSADERATLLVRPGITCRSSIAFANEAALFPPDCDPEAYYIERILPAKCSMNIAYVENLSVFEDMAIAFATVRGVLKKEIGEPNDE